VAVLDDSWLNTQIRAGSEAGRALAEKRKSVFIERYLPDVRALPGARRAARNSIRCSRSRACRTHALAAAKLEQLMRGAPAGRT
jgi:hypothetical protein